jgi:hypothetical protein
MSFEYYAFPLAADKLIGRLDHPKCSLPESVEQHLHLLITTTFGELPGDDRFGCCIWEYDFDNLTSSHKVKEFIGQSLMETILRYERRLTGPRIDLKLGQLDPGGAPCGQRLKKIISVRITGYLQDTNEAFEFRDSFFTGPLSYQ